MRGVWRLPLVHDRLLRKQVLRRGHGCGLLPRWPGGHFGLYRRAGQRRQQWEAQVPEKFESLEDVKAYLGAFLPGDAEHQE